jgi:hypothetical protein
MPAKHLRVELGLFQSILPSGPTFPRQRQVGGCPNPGLELIDQKLSEDQWLNGTNDQTNHRCGTDC